MRSLTAPVTDQVELIAHRCDGDRWAHLGRLPSGAPAEVNAAVEQADLIVVVSAMTFHYLAGLGGGRKMLVPGIASRGTATAIHAETLNQDPPGRRAGIEPGPCTDNPMHRAILTAVDSKHDVVGICVVPGPDGPLDAAAGPLLAHHHALGSRFVRERTVLCPPPPAARLTWSR